MRTCALAVTLIVLAALGVSIPAAAAPPPPTLGAPVASDTVTLITGDVVRLDTDASGRQHASVVRTADRRGGIHTFTSGGDVYAEPASASPLIAAGRLDEQLFDVSA